MFRRIFGPKRDEVTGEWRKLHNDELNYLFPSPTNVQVIKWGRLRWAWRVARMGKRRGIYRILVWKHEGKGLEDVDVDGKIILKGIFSKWDVGSVLDRAGSG